MPRQPEFLSVKEVAEQLRLSVRKVYELTSSGDLPSYKIAGSVRIAQADFDAYLESCKQLPPADNKPLKKPPPKVTLKYLK